jgi:Right handed beta helix region
MVRRALLLAVAAALFAAAPAAASTTWFVDAPNPEIECPSAEFTSINAAIAAAQPGDHIRVCPGLYSETVVLNKPDVVLSARGTRDDHCFDPGLPPASPTKDAIIAPPFPATGLVITAAGVVVAGFDFQNSNFGITNPPAIPISGFWIHDNVFRGHANDAIRLRNASAGRVDHNCMRENGAHGMTLIGGHDVRIDHNATTRNGLAIPSSEGIHVIGLTAPAFDVTVEHNRSVNERLAIGLSRTADVVVTANSAVGSEFAAIRLESGNTGTQITHNHLTASGNGILFSPENIGFVPLLGPPSTGLLVSHNQTDSMVESGIRAEPNSLSASVLSWNSSVGNGQDGIRIEAGGNGGNTIANNQLLRNVEHDCHDDTVGPGSGGTANVWEHNHGETENRPGLCSKPS